MAEATTNKYFEQCLLGVMMSYNAPIDDILARVSQDFFYDAYHRYIFNKISSQWKTTKKVDLVTVSENENTDKVTYLASLTSLVNSVSDWEVYANTLEDCKKSREIPFETKKILEGVTSRNINEKIAQLQNYASTLSTGNVCGKSAKDAVFENVLAVQEAQKRTTPYKGFESGFEKLDKTLKGFQEKTFYIIGARPSVGKTAFALSLFVKLAKNNVKSAFFSLEMTTESLMFRVMAAESNIPVAQLENGLCGNSTSGNVGKFLNAGRIVSELPMVFYDQGVNLETKLISAITQEAKKGTKVIMIDHLALIKIQNSTGQRYQDLGNITDTLHQMCKSLNICIILLTQCGREAEGKVPNLSLLRESGDIEANADVVMLLHRKRETGIIDDNDVFREVPIDVIVAKNRNGATGTVPFAFQLSTMKFREDQNRSELNDEGTCNVTTQSKENKNDIPF